MPILKVGLCPLLTEDVVDKLAGSGISRVVDFICTEPAKITEECGIPYKSILSIRRVLLAQYSAFPLNGGNLYDESVATLSILSTRCPKLDELLCSGIFTGEVTEILGSCSTGKSQLCMTLAVSIAEDLEKNVVYIDSTCGFSPERTAQLIKGSSDGKKHVTEALSRIRVSKCKSAYHLFDILTVLRAMLNNADDSFAKSLKAVIVDSVSAAVETNMSNMTFVEGQSLLTMVKKTLNSLAKDFSLAVVVTTESYGGVAKDYQNSMKSPLSHTWSAAASTQIFLDRSMGLEMMEMDPSVPVPRPITVSVVKSPHAKEGTSVKLNIGAEEFVPA